MAVRNFFALFEAAQRTHIFPDVFWFRGFFEIVKLFSSCCFSLRFWVFISTEKFYQSRATGWFVGSKFHTNIRFFFIFCSWEGKMGHNHGSFHYFVGATVRLNQCLNDNIHYVDELMPSFIFANFDKFWFATINFSVFGQNLLGFSLWDFVPLIPLDCARWDMVGLWFKRGFYFSVSTVGNRFVENLIVSSVIAARYFSQG